MNKNLLAQQFRELSRDLQTREGYSPEQILSLISDEHSIPITVFSTRVSPLQALVSYLKTHEKLDFKEIASLLGRSYRAVWGSYQKNTPKPAPTTYYIPLKLFNSQLSILEQVVLYVHQEYDLRFSQIAQVLNKDDRTVWTCYHRAQKKERHK